MNTRRRALWLLAIQLAIVCSIAAKFLYERATCPRVWVQVEPWDPEMLVRGRYYAFTPLVDACALPHDKDAVSLYGTYHRGVEQKPEKSWTWRVTTFARDGKQLAISDARHVLPRSETSEVSYNDGGDCAKATLTPAIDFFVPEHAKPDLPLANPQGAKPRPNPGVIWLEVTVPPVGPPRAIQLATNIDGNWKVLSLR
jgi:hypothetical protein